jgi:hypothetical protein
MDRALAAKLKDKQYRDKLTKLVKDYAELGFRNVEYWSPEWDSAHDLMMCYAPLSKADYEKLEKGHPKRFVMPMTATQVTTMTTYIAQVLYGDSSPHKVEPRGPEDEIPSEHVNTLLRWNSEQQPTFLLGQLFVQDVLTFNRGIFYNSWSPIQKPESYEVEVEIPDEVGEDGLPIKYMSTRRRLKTVGGHCKMELVSPYDWVADPAAPLWKAQQGRFMGHRFKLAWTELLRRSKLPVDHPAYVRPEAVEELRKKNRPNSNIPPSLTGHGSTTGIRPDQAMSRSFYERQRITGPLVAETANKADPGTVECIELWVKLVPSDQGIHDGDDVTVFQFILANGDTILAVNESTYDHGMFPYTYAEGRPTAHYQFGPSWAFMLKGLQDHVDYLKNRHQEALQRTVGNVFVANPHYVDLEDFLNPDKEGLVIPLKPAAVGQKISDVIQQIPIKDLTEGFTGEMQSFVSYSENVTGANNYMQGVNEPGGTATEFAGTQQMAAGRMSSVARLISVQAIVPQTKQFVSMFQQFLEEVQKVRYVADPFQVPTQLLGMNVLDISRDTIQGEFDFIAHDGSLPTGDAKKVAGISRLLQVASAFPQVFQPAPGNLDPRALIVAGAKASGLNDLERFFYDPTTFQSAVAGQVGVAMPGMVPQVGAPPAVEPPVMPGAAPGPAPATPTLPDIGPPAIEPLAPSQPRPETI